jgi:uncharacterized protein (TIGR03905 family)
MISYEYIPKNICSSLIKVFIDENTDSVKSVAILGGCHGNLTAIMRLLKGKSVSECVEALSGIKCGRRGTSCPDQVAMALELYLKGTWKNDGNGH